MLFPCLMFCNGLFRHPKKSPFNDRNNKNGLQGCNSLQKCWCGKNLPLWSCMNCLTFMVVWNQAPQWEKWQKKNIKQSEPSISLGRRAGSTTLLVAFVFCSGKSVKSCEIHKNMQNTVKFSTNLIKINTCLYSIFETYLSYWGYLIAVNLQIFLETSSLKHANNVTKLPGVDYVAKNLVLATMFKALLLVHFWSLLLLKEQILTSVRKTLKTLVWSGQNWLISSKFALKITTKLAVFTDCYSAKFGPKISAKLANFSMNLSLKSCEIWLFFPQPIRSPAVFRIDCMGCCQIFVRLDHFNPCNPIPKLLS